MFISFRKEWLLLVVILTVGVGCSSQNDAGGIPSGEGQQAHNHPRLESEIQRIESQIGVLENRLFYANLVGVVIIGVGFIILWKRGTNRKDELRKIKSKYRRIRKELKGVGSGLGGVKNKTQAEDASHSQDSKLEISRLKNRVETLETEVKKLRSRGERDPSNTSTEGEKSRDESGSSNDSERKKGSVAQRTKTGGRRTSQNEPETRSTDASQTGASQHSADRSKGKRSTGQEGRSESKLKDDYNRLLREELSGQAFEERYDLVPLGVENEQQRLSDDEAPVLLQENERGRYRAVKMGNHYLVFPRPGIMVEDPIRREAGFDEVFQCEDLAHNHPYKIKRLDSAARFIEGRGGTLKMKSPGRVALRRYD